MSSSNSPCAACKIQRRKCTQDCVFAPYFPPDQPQKFANVHKVFGASNVSKLLQELSAEHREDAVNSLAYEAEARLRDPVYGCVGLISILQHRLKQVQSDLLNAKKELATYIGPQAMLPIFQTPAVYMPQGNPSSSSVYPYNAASAMMGFQQVPPRGGQLVIREPQAHQQQQAQPQLIDAQQLAVAVAAREQQQELMMRLALEQKMAMYQQSQPQPQPQYPLEPIPQNLSRFISPAGYDPRIGPPDESGFNQMGAATTEEPTLVLGSGFDNTTYPIQPQQSEHNHSHHQLQEQHNDHSHQQLGQEQHHSNVQLQEQYFDLDSTPQQPFLQLGPQPQLRHKLEGEEDKRTGPPF